MIINKNVETKFGSILVTQGLIEQTVLDEALEEQKKKGYINKKLGEYLIESGAVSEDDVVKGLGIQFNLPILDISEIVIEKDILSLVNEITAKRFNIIPLYKVGNELTVAIYDPTDIDILDYIGKESKCVVTPVLATKTSIQNSIALHYTEALAKELTGTYELKKDDYSTLSFSEIERLRNAGKDVSIVKIVDKILHTAIDRGASDIHIEPGEEKLRVRQRVDGILEESFTFVMSIAPAIVSRVKILSELDIAERNVPQDGRIQMEFMGKDLDLRVSTLPIYYGEKVVMRILDRSNVKIALEDLGMSEQNLKSLKLLLSQPYGIILVTGPTGSGKSTTLYASLNHINTMEKNIITVEDPVEYQLPIINQTPINVKKGVTFAGALRSILRQDPDIVMIGEIRDPETGSIAAEAALTGHLVLSTLHTNDAPSAVTRLIDMGIEPFLLAPSLLGIVAQRLLRKVCTRCREAYNPTEAELEELKIKDLMGKIKFVNGKGCKSCKGSGYRGRVGVHEILMVDEQTKTFISEKASTSIIRAHAMKRGFKPLRFDALKKAIAGITSIQEVIRVTKD